MRRRRWIGAAGLLAVACVIGASPAQADEAGSRAADPLATASGVFKLQGQTAGVPYSTAEGAVGLVTARHGVGDSSTTAWSLSDAMGASSKVSVIPGHSSSAIDVALLRPVGSEWGGNPAVALSDDYRSMFQSAAKGPADTRPGDRVCRTGWSPLSRGADGQRVANVIPAPDIPGAASGVICGRIIATGDTLVVGQSDRPDGLIVGNGDSGGAVWKVTEGGAFMYLGMIRGGVLDGPSLNGSPTGSMLYAVPAWRIASGLNVTPATDPALARPFLTIDPSTYYPTPGGTVTLTGMLRDADGSVLAGKKVDVLQTGSSTPVGSGTTDMWGRVQVEVSPPKPRADFALRFAGDETVPAVASRWVTVSPTIVTIEAPVSVANGEAITVRARATSAAGDPIVGRAVRTQIYPVGSNAYEIGESAMTDADGYVTLSIPAQGTAMRYAVRLGSDPSTNGNPVGAAASAIYRLDP
ncbi:hypothetical protein [Leifsonia naganoensis]|uniref:Big-1 domain-containing protein n=1 Tax=Leifsonia naganoensis TaxID=150025 RepID=A0A853DVJ0_9MICO|nr:hypothetical protein [Leifsonia naganoensis]NYK10220.1 hypothetical protein [Leifsonia naganoensis]